MRPRLLDLFCGAGGAGMGYHRAGFEVVGVDHLPQPDYPFEFHEADAMTFPLDGFDAIHASPPCQAFTAMGVMHNAKVHADLLTPTRARLIAQGTPYVIENVPGAPMTGYVVLCGSSMGLGLAAGFELRRHRLFESTFPIMVPPCAHQKPTIGLYGDHARDRRRQPTGPADRGLDFPDDRDKIALAREALGIPWVKSWKGLSQAIPPAFTEHIGGYLLAALNAEAAA